MKTHYLPGKRTIKTALSVVICFLTVSIINHYFDTQLNSFYAGLTAVFTLQMDMDYTKQRGFQRTYGTFIGSGYGIIFMTLYYKVFNYHFAAILLFIGIILCIHTTYLLKMNDAAMISCILLLGCFTIYDDNYIAYIVYRTIETIYGVFIAYHVNKYIFPYKNKDEENYEPNA